MEENYLGTHPNLLAKVMEVYVLPTIAQFATITIMFDLWMFRIGFNFTNDNWVPYHVILGLFKALNTF
jgi:hypothetical protein